MLTSKHTYIGIYGYLGEHLLDIVSASDGYEFLARDSSFVDTYNFKREQNPYTGRVHYTLPAPKNVGISAYFRELEVSFTMTLWGMLGKLFLLKGITD